MNDLTFDWNDFKEKNFQRMMAEKNPDIYGHIFVQSAQREYIVDVQWETYESFDRNGVSLNLYETGGDGMGMHGKWIDDIQTISFSKSYERLQRRAANAIRTAIKKYEA